MRKLLSSLLILLSIASCSSSSSDVASRVQLESNARAALSTLYNSSPAAKALGDSAVGILVFPSIVKGGFVFGGQFGEGVLFERGNVVDYYSSVSASFGLQAGLQKFGYALFFMRNSDIKYLNTSEGWEVGVGPTVTVIDKGLASSLSTTTAREGVYAFFFEQQGLMAGLGLQGTKISRLK